MSALGGECVCSGGLLWRCLLWGGVSAVGVSAPGRVGVSAWGGVCSWGGCIPACTEEDNPPPPINRMTDACKT